METLSSTNGGSFQKWNAGSNISNRHSTFQNVFTSFLPWYPLGFKAKMKKKFCQCLHKVTPSKWVDPKTSVRLRLSWKALVLGRTHSLGITIQYYQKWKVIVLLCWGLGVNGEGQKFFSLYPNLLGAREWMNGGKSF
jgi:hypothetical protein